MFDYDIIEHFLDQSWDVYVAEEDADRLKAYPFLDVSLDEGKHQNRPYRISLKSDIPDNHVAEIWKRRYEELSERYEEMYRAIRDLVENY